MIRSERWIVGTGVPFRWWVGFMWWVWFRWDVVPDLGFPAIIEGDGEGIVGLVADDGVG
jgi:hypothetical protein